MYCAGIKLTLKRYKSSIQKHLLYDVNVSLMSPQYISYSAKYVT